MSHLVTIASIIKRKVLKGKKKLRNRQKFYFPNCANLGDKEHTIQIRKNMLQKYRVH